MEATGTPYNEQATITTANGCAAGTVAAPCSLEGRNGIPVLNGATGSLANGISIDRDFWQIQNLTITNYSTRHIAATGALNIGIYGVTFLRGSVTPTSYINAGSCTLQALLCTWDGSTSAALLMATTGCQFDSCLFQNLNQTVFLFGSGTSYVQFRRCRFYNSTAKFLTSSAANANGHHIDQCSFDTCTDDAIDFSVATHRAIRITNTVFANINGSGKAAIRLSNNYAMWAGWNAFYNCTANYSGITSLGNDVALSSLPWTGSGDFTPNQTAGGGSALRGAGRGGIDIGAIGVADLAGGGVSRARIFGGI